MPLSLSSPMAPLPSKKDDDLRWSPCSLGSCKESSAGAVPGHLPTAARRAPWIQATSRREAAQPTSTEGVPPSAAEWQMKEAEVQPLGELSWAQQNSDEVTKSVLASIAEGTPRPLERIGLLEQRLDQLQESMEETPWNLQERLNQLQHSMEEKLHAQRREFEQRLQRLVSSSSIAASVSETSLIRYEERLCSMEGLLDEQRERGKALTEGVMQLGTQLERLEEAPPPKSSRCQKEEEIQGSLEDLASRIECQELAHAHLYASVLSEGAKPVHAYQSQAVDSASPSTTAFGAARIRHLEVLVDKIASDLVSLEADAKLGPPIIALMEGLRGVAPKLEEHERGLNELRSWREKQSRGTKTLMAAHGRPHNELQGVEKQLEQSISFMKVDNDALWREMARLKAKINDAI